jgi:hypothetical protein
MQDITKFEFLLTLEKNIVIQRYFNVMNYNPDAKYSVDLYECVKHICNEISSDLKEKTLDLMNENMEFITDMQSAEERASIKEEHFLLRIKLGEDVFISRIFPAHIYHPKARYAVDIRPKVRKILSELTSVLSSEVLTTTYLQYELVKERRGI